MHVGTALDKLPADQPAHQAGAGDRDLEHADLLVDLAAVFAELDFIDGPQPRGTDAL